jgi:hypothetical protein
VILIFRSSSIKISKIDTNSKLFSSSLFNRHNNSDPNSISTRLNKLFLQQPIIFIFNTILCVGIKNVFLKGLKPGLIGSQCSINSWLKPYISWYSQLNNQHICTRYWHTFSIIYIHILD